jgi:hypothetical protein
VAFVRTDPARCACSRYAGENGASDACGRHVSHGVSIFSGLPIPPSAKEQHEANGIS